MNRILQLLDELDAQRAELTALGPLRPEVKQALDDKLRLDWNYHSNRMEGSPITLEETRSIMADHITVEGRPLKYVLEMRGHDAILRRIQTATDPAGLRITERFIKEIHATIIQPHADAILATQIGKWRTTASYLYNNHNERVDFTPPEEVAAEMNAMVNWLDNQYYQPVARGRAPLAHPVVLAAELHLRFIQIHPFYDGNGRVCRILMNLLLISADFPPAIIRTEDRDTYNLHLSHATAYEQDPVPFVGFIAGRVGRTLELALRAARGESIEDEQDWKKRLAVISKMKEQATETQIWQLDYLIELFQKIDSDLSVLRQSFDNGFWSFQEGIGARSMNEVETISKIIRNRFQEQSFPIKFYYQINDLKNDSIIQLHFKVSSSDMILSFTNQKTEFSTKAFLAPPSSKISNETAIEKSSNEVMNALTRYLLDVINTPEV